jgi:HD-GYP domain-containing protein (c-di-GMP phosphodiesterase class II)
MSIEQFIWIGIPGVAAFLYARLLFTRRQGMAGIQLWFSMFLGAGMIWSAGSMLLHANPGFVDPVWWVRMSAFGTISMPWLMYNFTVRFLSLRNQQPWKALNVLLLIAIQVLNFSGAVVSHTTVVQGLVTNDYNWAFGITALFWFGYFAPSAWNLLREMRRTSDPAFRKRVRYLLMVMGLLLLGNLVNATPLGAYPLDLLLAALAAGLISVSISRYHIQEAHQTVRRLTVLGVGLAIYVPLATILLNWMAQLDSSARLLTSIGVVLGSVVLVALIPPTRRLWSDFVERFFLPEQYNVHALIYGISDVSNHLRLPGDLGHDILKQLTHALQIDHAALFVKQEPDQPGPLGGGRASGPGHDGAPGASPLYKPIATLGLVAQTGDVAFRADSPLIRELAQYRMALHVERLQELPRLRALWVEEWEDLQLLQAVVLVPIMAEGDLIGFFSLGARNNNAPYTHDELVQTLPLLANQISIALANSRLYMQEQTRANMLARANTELRQTEDALRQSTVIILHEASRAEALLRIAHRLNGQLELGTVLQAICEETARAMGMPAVSVSLYDERQQALRHSTGVGLPPAFAERIQPLPRAEYERYLKSASGVIVASGTEQLADTPDHDIFATLDIRTVISASMVRDSQLVGALNVYVFGECRPVSEDEQALLKGLAALAAQAIANARLYAEAQRRFRNVQALRDIDMAITGSVDLHVTLKVVLQQVTGQLRVDAADVMMLTPYTGALEYAAGQGFRTAVMQRRRMQLGDWYGGNGVFERNLVCVSDTRASGGCPVSSAHMAGEGFVAYVGIALMAKGQMKGLLEIFQRTPLDPDKEWLSFLEALSVQTAIAIDNSQLFTGLQRSNVELSIAYESTLEGWARALELRDHETQGHTRRVTELAEKLARARGMTGEELLHIRRGALLHDIGKMGIPDSILLKPGPLTPEEWDIMRQHPMYAYQLLSSIPFLRAALDIPYCHHERWDGTGYPRGLKGTDIPLSARIFALADVWDALRSNRPYHTAWPDEQVYAYVMEHSGTQFDPEIVRMFVDQVLPVVTSEPER